MDDLQGRRYLLGLLDEAEADAVERAFVGDADAFEALLVTEDELVDAYVSGELDAAEVAAFEARVAVVPGFAARVAFARALAERAAPGAVPAVVSGRPSLWERVRAWLFPRTGVPGWAWAAALVAVVAVGVTQLGPGPGPATVGVALRPDALRAAVGGASLAVPGGVDTVTVRLEVELPGEFPSYRVALSRGEATVFAAEDLRPDADGTITVAVPAARLASGGHTVALEGVRGEVAEPVAFYSLAVTVAP